MPNLPGDYIAGFVDGEECFYLTYRSEKKYDRKGQPTYYRDDIDILKQINKTLMQFIPLQALKGNNKFWIEFIKNIDLNNNKTAMITIKIE